MVTDTPCAPANRLDTDNFSYKTALKKKKNPGKPSGKATANLPKTPSQALRVHGFNHLGTIFRPYSSGSSGETQASSTYF